MRDEIESVMRVHNHHVTTSPRNGKNEVSFTRKGGRYPGWKTVSDNLGKLENDVLKKITPDEISTSFSTGQGSANPIPWFSIRPSGQGKGKAKTTQGIYITYLFSQDGEKCVLAIMQATTESKNYPGNNTAKKYHSQRINQIQKYADHIRSLSKFESSDVDTLSSQLNQTYVDLKATKRKYIEWEHACSHWIEYERNMVPSDEILLSDLKIMIKLYKQLAGDSLKIKTGISETRALNDDAFIRDSVISENQKYVNPEEGWELGIQQANSMIESISILPYTINISEELLEFKREDWIRLSQLFKFIQIQNDEIVFVRQGTQSTDGEELMRVVRCYRNVIIEGPPGVGKTHFFDELRKEFKENVTFLTFHPSTEYGDFIGGLRPAISQKLGKDSLEFKSTRGFFLKALEQTKSGKTLLWIDEINRGNVAKIFGELIGLIGTNNPQSPTIRNAGLDKGLLDMSKNGGIVLDNLHIVGTINTADRSISHLDSAIRRRFKFVRLHPNLTISAISSLSVIQQFEHINNLLKEKYGSDGMLGHSYLFELKDNPGREENIWKYSILPNIADIIMREGTESAEEVIEDINAHVPVDWKLKKRGKSYSAIVEVVYKVVE